LHRSHLQFAVPRSTELDSGYLGENVHRNRFTAHAEKRTAFCEICYRQALQRSAEFPERRIDRLRFSRSGLIQISRSFVARGCACIDTAYAPTTRYLTLCAFKTDKSSLKSGYIRRLALQCVHSLSQFANCVHPLVHRPALPVAIFFRLDLVQLGDPGAFANARAFCNASGRPVRLRAPKQDLLSPRLCE